MFSDYGGDQGRYRTYSFAVVDWNALHGCVQHFKTIREKHGLNAPYKEIAFKSMGYGPQDRALDDFLFAAEHAPGLLFNLIVEDSIQSLGAEDGKRSHRAFEELLRREGLGDWKGAVAERLLRIVHTVAYLVALLARDGQKIMWMTDHDAIAANADKLKHLGAVLGRVLQLYARVSYGTIGYAVPFPSGEDDLCLRDLLSIADLSAGSIAHFYTAVATSDDPKIKIGANKVLLWLSQQGLVLKRLNFVLRREGDGRIVAAVPRFIAKETGEEETVEIPIYFPSSSDPKSGR